MQRPQDGWRVDRFLTARLHRYSRSQVQALIDEGRVLRRDLRLKASAKVRDGETIVIHYPKRPEPPPVASRLEIVFEDDVLLAVNKPAGILSHPTDKVVENAVTTVLRKQFPELTPRLAHRLDRETSGVLLLAKTVAAARELHAQFVGRDIEKEYLAVVHGAVEWSERVVDAAIERDGGLIKVKQAAGRGRRAVTELVRKERGEDFSLVAARPRTGRLHQIRVHLAHVGHPILGDKLYTEDGRFYLKAVARALTDDDREALGCARQMLHAAVLTLRHPSSGRRLVLRAPLPDDFQDALSACGLKAA